MFDTSFKGRVIYIWLNYIICCWLQHKPHKNTFRKKWMRSSKLKRKWMWDKNCQFWLKNTWMVVFCNFSWCTIQLYSSLGFEQLHFCNFCDDKCFSRLIHDNMRIYREYYEISIVNQKDNNFMSRIRNLISDL